MNNFLSGDFLTGGETGAKLYNEYASALPVIDYHNHLNPKDIALDRRYDNMTELWLQGDHYKWRLMRWAGVPEAYITGSAEPFEKFLKWAEVLQRCVGNPVYIWSCLELKRYFGIDEPLTSRNAEAVYRQCGEKLKEPCFSVRGLIDGSRVEFLCTTDDPADSLEWHEKIAAAPLKARVAPAWRPDRAVNIEAADYREYIARLSEAAGIEIKDYAGLKDALAKRLDYFSKHGCSISDHALDYVYFDMTTDEAADRSFSKAFKGESLNEDEIRGFKTIILRHLSAEYAKRGWVMQLHYGCKRNANALMSEKLGENTGFDCISGCTPALTLIEFLNSLAYEGCLPKTIIYSLNPNDDRVIASIAGTFQEGGVKGKVQHGSAWWFNDHADGILSHLRSLASIGYLPAFVGMLTDGRSFLSFSRHEYFRRLLCGLLGGWADAGEFPRDLETLGEIVKDISYRNAREYFSIRPPKA
jgi:glucuronate isomerase